MKIAIIGTGISGLTAGYLLAQRHDVVLFEAQNYVGGHTATIDVEVASGRYAVDTGFIVFNDWTYPHFMKMMSRVGVVWQDSSMSFSVKSAATGLEYNGTSIDSLFAQRSNFFRPRFHRMVRDILRFNRESLEVLESNGNESLREYLQRRGYSDEFKKNYIVPMGAAIWSSSSAQMDEFPVEYFVRFFKNHGMLSVNERPVWKVIKGGSKSYVAPLTAQFKDQIKLNSPVQSVVRTADSVKVHYRHQGVDKQDIFDQVIFASHSDQTMKMLFDITPDEREILSGFRYQPNSTILHTDIRVLPRRKKAWAAWNYAIPRLDQGNVSVTYNMNILQGFSAPEVFCVSLNMDDQIDPAKILKKMTYHHPVYTRAAFESQKNWGKISGKNRTHFCGAYWGYGFHEDGVRSAVDVCKSFGEVL